jgi:glucan phosphoethanolaminetransferase (alkaline phosphatase superfamily)
VSVSTLINRLKYPNGLPQISQEDNCLFKLAKENNFSTYFLSGQTTSHLQIIRDLMCPKYIDKLVDRNDFPVYIKPKGYDEDLQTLIEKMNLLEEKHLIVLQQRGSHSPYAKQYPKEYDKHTPYENTALYTDNSLYKLIKYVKENSKSETFLFYVSDHGELLGENGKKGHGHLSKEVYEVPFLMYTNSKNEKLKEQFKHTKNHYDISNYVLSLLGYKAELIKEEDRRLYILNADLDGFSGYGTIDINSSVESRIEIKRY